MDETLELGIRAQMYKKVAHYVKPKRKAGVQANAGPTFVDFLKSVNAA